LARRQPAEQKNEAQPKKNMTNVRRSKL
jgi:hypothetical protein